MTREITTLRTVGAFANKRACADTLFHVLNEAYDHPLKLEEQAIQIMAGGIMQHGYQCGMIWGSTLAAGAQAFRLYGVSPLAETKAISAGQRIVESFSRLKNHINCLEITHIDKSSSGWEMFTYFFLKGGTIGCFRMAAQYAPIAFREINAAMAEEPLIVPVRPVSCATLLARKMGASEVHATMAAGLAGGVGLCGGACGALGAALWLTQLKSLSEGATKADYKNPQGLELIERFLKATDYRFECSGIVRRKFKGIEDHGAYIAGGGCRDIIDVLAGLR